MTIEETILSNLVLNEEYSRKIVPFLKLEYFASKTHQTLYTLINDFIVKYNAFPTKEALSIDLDGIKGLNEKTFKETKELIDTLSSENSKLEWLLNTTEKWCRTRALYNAAKDTLEILDGNNKNLSEGSIPDIFSEALAVSFDSHIGHDYLEDTENQYNSYHEVSERIPFDLELFNKITNGGLKKKTLNLIIGGIGAGKTLMMCHMAAANLLIGKNVLYITLEISQEEIIKRIDANLLNIDINQLVNISKEDYFRKTGSIKKKTSGKLIVKEYPTSQASSAHFRHLIHELNIKLDFIPDIIYIDYINLCLSARVKYGQAVNSYTLIKSIAEEFRGLAVECNVPVFSGTQYTRNGMGSSDPEMQDTSESIGLPATVDLQLAIITSEELDTLNQIMIKQLKTRYGDISLYNKFVIGRDKSKMRLYNIEECGQNLVEEELPKIDKFTNFK